MLEPMTLDTRIQCTFYYNNGSSRSWESSYIGIKHKFPRKTKELGPYNARPFLVYIETAKELNGTDRDYFIDAFMHSLTPGIVSKGVYFNKELGRC